MLLNGLSDDAILWTMALLALVTGWVSDLRVPVVGLSCLIFGGVMARAREGFAKLKASKLCDESTPVFF